MRSPAVSSVALGPVTLLSAAVAAATKRDLINPSEVDYVIIGGGTAGLTVAYRLAQQNPSMQVAVIGAGG